MPGALVPVPESATVCGLPVTLSAMFRVAARLPMAEGVKVTLTFVLPPGATVIGIAAVVSLKSAALAPVIVIPEIIRFAVPGLLMVTGVGVLLLLAAWLPKATLAGLMLMAGAIPVPDRPTACGLPLALSVKLIDAVRAPAAAGLKVTYTVAVPPDATTIGVVDGVKLKSAAFAPEIAIPVITRFAVPELPMVMAVGLLATFTCWLPKLRLAGERLITGVVPVPVNDTNCGLPVALSVMVSVAERLPVADGVNVMAIDDAPEGLMVAGSAM